MANPFTKVANKIVYSLQEMFNQSFDADFNQNTVEVLNYDPTNNTLNRAFPANALNLKPFDYVLRSLAGDGVTETWTFKSGGSSGTTTNTVVIVYADSTLATISTITKT